MADFSGRVKMVIIKVVVAAFLVAWGFAMTGISPRNAIGEVIALSLFLTVPYLYFLPTIEANLRDKPNTQSIALVNILLGWTLVGWLVSLVWAIKEDSQMVAMVQAAQPSGDTATCPHCAETVKAAAKVCKHCHGVLTPPVAASTPPVAVSGAPDNAIATMAHYGITFKQDKYWFGQYAYDNLADAVNYANKQSATAV
jgi:hypothetical protein